MNVVSAGEIAAGMSSLGELIIGERADTGDCRTGTGSSSWAGSGELSSTGEGIELEDCETVVGSSSGTKIIVVGATSSFASTGAEFGDVWSMGESDISSAGTVTLAGTGVFSKYCWR